MRGDREKQEFALIPQRDITGAESIRGVA